MSQNGTDPESISAKTDRLEEIIDQLETGDVPLAEAKRLYEEGQELLSELEDDMDVGEGDVAIES